MHLLGLHPTTAVPNPGDLAKTMRFGTAEALVRHARAVEEEYGLNSKMAAARWATRIGDGLEEGPMGMKVSQQHALTLGLKPSSSWGSLDGWHSCESAGTHADSWGGGPYICQYLASARSMRSRFGFGTQAAVPAAAAWLAQMCPKTGFPVLK